MRTIAFVTPWYGQDIPGGAEALTRRTAGQMAAAGLPVEIITTTIRDFYADWSHNAHRPGITTIDGIPVRRFPVEARRADEFNRVNWRLTNGLEITSEEEQIFAEEMLRSPALLAFLADHRHEYLYVFIPYLYPTTIQGLAVAPERSIVIPCLHDEGYAYLPSVREALSKARGLALLSRAEHALAARLLGPADRQARLIVGAGVEPQGSGDGDRFREKYGLDGPLMLYAGRREAGKNTPLLIDYWLRYVKSGGRQATLVLIGPGEITLPDASGDIGGEAIRDLGFVSRQDKLDAYAAATALCQPSTHESFSIVIMESWLARRPVLVHADCAVTVEHCRLANGGLYFADYREFAATTDYLFDHPAIAGQLGRQGRRYVLENFTPETVIGRFQTLFDEVGGL
ncbi:MAG: glycosyltransferase family 4 protein [Candidatus Promineifilaceae bacterium]